MHLLTLDRVGVVYGAAPRTVTALTEVSFSLARGELTLILGPSGSGKTTLLSVMGCLLRPTTGLVWAGGLEVSQVGERQLPRLRGEFFGYIFQQHRLFAALTALENVELALSMKFVGYPDARGEAVRLLAAVGLTARLDHRPTALSGGEQQRVAVARALAGNPSVILSDKPTASLDSENAFAVADLLRQLAHRDGKAVVMVTHDVRLGEFADRTLRLADGRLQP
jgi:putative ABC transport system ATP-binding protein